MALEIFCLISQKVLRIYNTSNKQSCSKCQALSNGSVKIRPATSLPVKPEVVKNCLFLPFLTGFWVTYVTGSLNLNFPSVRVTSGQTGSSKKFLIFPLINIALKDSNHF